GRPAEALAHVEEVSDHEDREDRGLRDDQAGHAYGAAIGQAPVRGRLVTGDRDGAHDARLIDQREPDTSSRGSSRRAVIQSSSRARTSWWLVSLSTSWRPAA